MQTINLNQNSFRLFPTIYMVQNDTGRELKMILDDVTLDGTETGAVAIKRSDGSYYTITATIDATNNAFDADMTQALTQPSRTECQLKVTTSDDTVISTYTFIIMVQPSTDGISEAQLGYSVQQLRQDAEDIRAGGMPYRLRLALLQIAEKVAYIDGNGAQYYQDLYDALQPPVSVTSISATYTQSGTVYTHDTMDSLKADLVVSASWSDGTTTTVPAADYILSGTLEAGTSTITVTYEGKTDTFEVAVTAGVPSAYTIYDYIQSNATSPSAYAVPYDGQIRLKTYADLNQVGCEFKYKALSSHTAGSCLFGRRTASGAASSYAFYSGNGTLGYHLHGNDSTPAPNATVNSIHVVNFMQTASSPSSLQVDTGSATSVVWSNSNTINADPCLLMNPYNNTTNFNLSYHEQLGYIKILAIDGTLLNHYFPVVRDADHVIGMFDIVDQVFYTANTSSYATIGNGQQKYTVGNWS